MRQPAATSPPPARIASPTGTAPRIGRIDPAAFTPRLGLMAVPGWGKTTMGAYAPSPLIVMARGENGYKTLRQAGLVPDVDVSEVDTWPELLALMTHLTANPNGHKTLVLDAMGGAERLCHEFVCARDFKGDWGERGFASYQKGFDLSVNEWLGFLNLCERWQKATTGTVLILSHAKVRTFKNPLGSDFDRYVPDCHEKTWAATERWLDAVLFGTYVSVIVGNRDDATKKGKGQGGTSRVIYAEQRDAYIAKNRYGMEPEIDIPDDPSKVWDTVWAQVIRNTSQGVK
jgi:hypothetical protein